jgi:phosphoribosylformylglycinamidine (FGAM) synthase-like enzyme
VRLPSRVRYRAGRCASVGQGTAGQRDRGPRPETGGGASWRDLQEWGVAHVAKFSVHHSDGDGAPAHLARLLPDLKVWRDYYVQTEDELTAAQRAAIAAAITEPVTERVDVDIPLQQGSEVQVSYKRGIIDNESDTIVELCRVVGVNAEAARVATTYASSQSMLATVIHAEACNHNIEEMHESEPAYDSLLPVGEFEPMKTVDLRGLPDEELLAIGTDGGRSLELDKMLAIRRLQEALGVEAVSDVLLEALDARWSDHCAHTTWKSLGNLLGKMITAAEATANTNIVSMFHDNAGIWEFYDGYGIAVKPETHNGPSAVSAYFGQLTKVGGVLRDILGTGKGADPIGAFEYTATGRLDSPSPIAGRPSPKQIAHETIRAVKEYGNTFGVPMMWSHMTFHDSYRAKPFALGGSIGLIPLEHADKGVPEVGDLVVLIGGLTGNDGIHGATGSSAGAVMDSTSVQIGSPLEEIKFREAILELRDAGCLRAVTDLGAAGINSAAGEMGEHTGVWVNTALVPLKTHGLAMWRILLSESQERMLLAVAPEQFTRAREILQRHAVRNSVIGRFTDNERYCVVHDSDISEKHVLEMDVTAPPDAAEVGFDVPYELLKYRPVEQLVDPPRQKWQTRSEWPDLSPSDLAGVAGRMLADGELCSQAYASSQYDSSVLGRNYYGPDVYPEGPDFRVPTGYYASRPVFGSQAALVFNVAFNPWLYEAHPVLAARQSFLSVLLTQVLAGVEITDVCLCDNFYTPHLEEDAYSWLVGMVHELADLSQQFRTPFISGKDSSAGSTHTDNGVVSVPPGVFLSALGKVPHIERLRSERLSNPGNLLVRVGIPTPSLAGTVAARVFDLDANDVDDVHPQMAYTFLEALSQLPSSVALSGRVIGAGGIVGTAVLQSLSSGLGVELDVPAGGCAELLQEHRCAALIEVPPEALDELLPQLAPLVVGRVVDGPPSVRVDGVDLLTPSARAAWTETFEKELA